MMVDQKKVAKNTKSCEKSMKKRRKGLLKIHLYTNAYISKLISIQNTTEKERPT